MSWRSNEISNPMTLKIVRKGMRNLDRRGQRGCKMARVWRNKVRFSVARLFKIGIPDKSRVRFSWPNINNRPINMKPRLKYFGPFEGKFGSGRSWGGESLSLFQSAGSVGRSGSQAASTAMTHLKGRIHAEYQLARVQCAFPVSALVSGVCFEGEWTVIGRLVELTTIA